MALGGLLALLLLAGPARAAPTFPALTGRVVDEAGIIPPDETARLEQKLAALEQTTGRQLVVATLADLQGYDIADYGYQLGRHWGIGEKDKNTGAILIVAPNQRKVRIEVGYGLEGTITDGLSALIIQQQILPRFKAGDMPGGIEAGADALIQQLGLSPEDAARQAQAADRQAAQRRQGSGVDPGAVFFVLIVIVFFVLPALRRAFGGRRYRSDSGLGPLILFEVLDHMSRGGGRGGGDDWGGGGFGGGGGFSGGGGSFGGGGASGSW
ncbi:TPM domain-containing protein [Novosphingobium piscinae]|uniref:TPM domain-containing protein n=1 Tax=Novosphingobium piscinae TaxID=1507448 RepID=A0A7X1FXE1_9SPHN|nr:TPM domain-containing protein [Novosphingobium piscinae]MBC2668107.1 TPM domain-containing protein [Novosphingobium piscinae]